MQCYKPWQATGKTKKGGATFSFQMSSQSAVFSKGSATVLTLERLFTRMHSDMSLKRALFTEEFMALQAFIRQNITVGSGVNLSSILEGKSHCSLRMFVTHSFENE